MCFLGAFTTGWYAVLMTDNVKEAIEVLRTLPKDDQDTVAGAIIVLAAHDQHHSSPTLKRLTYAITIAGASTLSLGKNRLGQTSVAAGPIGAGRSTRRMAYCIRATTH